jgi:hypothetical protein
LVPVDARILRPGDVVELTCPKARREKVRRAVFEGLSMDPPRPPGDGPTIYSGIRWEWLERERGYGLWAMFELDRRGDDVLRAAFKVEEDGAMRDDQDRRVTVSRRLTPARKVRKWD